MVSHWCLSFSVVGETWMRRLPHTDYCLHVSVYVTINYYILLRVQMPTQNLTALSHCSLVVYFVFSH